MTTWSPREGVMSILRSFARDWARWSKAEREAAVVFVIMALVSPATWLL